MHCVLRLNHNPLRSKEVTAGVSTFTMQELSCDLMAVCNIDGIHVSRQVVIAVLMFSSSMRGHL